MHDRDVPYERLQRARGHALVRARLRTETTVLSDLSQQGSAKVLFPRRYDCTLEAVLLNTAGGVTGADHLRYEIVAEAGATVTVTSQAAERVYRSAHGDARIETTLTVEAGGRLDWLPQETILFNGGRLRRQLTVELAGDATWLGIEPLVLGRAAMRETVSDGFLSDQWRIRRSGQLVYADALRLTAPIDRQIASSATWGGARAAATLVYVAPDAEAWLERIRALTDQLSPVEAAVSTWNGLLCARFLAQDGAPLRRALIDVVTALPDSTMPRVWSL